MAHPAALLPSGSSSGSSSSYSNVDQLQRRFRDFLAFGCHRCYFFTDEAHDAFGKNRHVVDFTADQPTFDVFACGDGSDAGQCRARFVSTFLIRP